MAEGSMADVVCGEISCLFLRFNKNMYDHKRNGFFLISFCFLPFLVLYHFR